MRFSRKPVLDPLDLEQARLHKRRAPVPGAAFLGYLRANRLIAALSAARFADGVGESILYIALPLYVLSIPARFFDIAPPVAAGLLFALYGLVNACFQPVMGSLSDRLGHHKRFIQGGLALMSAATLGFPAARHLTDLLLLRSAQGIGAAMTIPSSMALMAAATESDGRGRAMGLYGTLRILGSTAGPLLGGLLLERYSFDLVFYLATALIVGSGVLVQLWVAESPAHAGPLRGAPAAGVEGFGPIVAVLGAATFLMAAAFTMITSLQSEFNSLLGQSAFGFSLAFSAFTLARVLAQAPFGAWADRLGRKPLILIGLFLMAPATALLPHAQDTLQFALLRALQGIAAAGISAPAFALVGDLATRATAGRQMSVLTMCFGFGVALGPLSAGVLALYAFPLPFYGYALLLLLCAWMVAAMVPETLRKPLTIIP